MELFKMQEKYGFIYLWYDRKHKRFYIGCRWGNENDGYVCSSSWMKQAFKHRPNDFKRRILTTNIQTRKETLLIESNWLQMIKPEELGKKYYNLTNHKYGHWTTDDTKRQSVNEKMVANHWSKNPEKAKIIKEKLSIAGKGRPNPSARRPRTEEEKRNISNKLKGKPLGYTRTVETRQKISENSKRLQREDKIGTKGMKYSAESKKKLEMNLQK
jgi:hypothetical protein